MNNIVNEQTRAAEEVWVRKWKQGPQNLRWNRLPVQAGDKAPDVTLFDSTKKKVRLSDFWSNGTAIFIFLRYFGCSCARDRVAQVRESYSGYLKLNANVAMISQSEPERTAYFADKYGVPCRILCDPEYRAFQAYDLLDGGPSQIAYGTSDRVLQRDPDLIDSIVESHREAGHHVGDSPWQLPGEFVIDHRGIIHLAWRYQYCADFADPEVLTAALQEIGWMA